MTGVQTCALPISAVTLTTAATAQTTINPKGEVFVMGSLSDTAFGNTTKCQTSPVSPGGGVTVQYWLDQINDSCAGYASVWGSIDNVTFAPWPGADSVAITVGVDIKKLWFLRNYSEKNPVKYVQVRTRLTTSYTVGKAKVKTKVFPY